jgi:hypothetical protein
MKRFLFLPLIFSIAFQAMAASDKVEVKNRSSFAMENSRDPFWPIGWKPSARLSNPGAEKGASSEISTSAFLVSSITLGKTSRFAIVNGKIMAEGQQFGLQVGNQTYQITLKQILDGKVIFARRDQEIVVPLRRK